ncbi:MAG: DUF5606 domain-containing protein [Muribaculaceae bacterium]|nr:DUF5606 domain-containing protein [Muribaculaceae bacterium]
MLKRILSISGRPGLFRLVSQGKNMLIVESLQNGKRVPAYSHDKIISLGDVSMYTVEDDIPLGEVLTLVYNKAEGKPVDIKALEADKKIRDYFKEILPTFDEERVYTADIKKLFSWYNQLISAGITTFVEPEAEEKAEETTEEKQ